MKKKANLKAVRKTFSGRKLKNESIKLLKLKEKDKLAFVHQTVYNTEPVQMIKTSDQGGSISASYQKIMNLLFKGSRKEETTFTIPEKATFAFGLQEIMFENEKMEIPFESWTHKKNSGLFSHDSIDSDLMQQVREGIKMKEFLLKPLTDLPESTRQDLLKKLQEVLEERDALSLLEETLDQCSKGEYERPQSKVVSSFMDLLDESKVSTKVDSLKDKGEACPPESPPAPLQQDGELRWAAELLCSCDETLTELSNSWDRPPEVLLEVLALTVLGVHMLQPRV
ncbi:hypothetical protein GOODEAATRI_010611 [Goodea atripinnis]|uniref:Gasdermin pore forming domain-containing protein n=1 Tax=Goodea atripinnis TaxID=208336 RepID=A0ABV0PMF7_9TELE